MGHDGRGVETAAMSDRELSLSRDIGGLEARMDEHERRFARVEGKIDAGFQAVTDRLDALTASENRRKGALGVMKAIVGGGLLTGVIEAARAWYGK